MTIQGAVGATKVMDVSHLAKHYGQGDSKVDAIRDITFDVTSGEFLCVVGPSGCGKTSLLKCLSGLLEPSSGEARLQGVAISRPAPNLALVFQDYSRSLLPWMSVGKNVALPLEAKRLARSERASLVRSSLRAVGLHDAADRYPWQLSGGMQQRVAIARAIAYRPEILLMDEPFASVDAQTRTELEDLVLQVWRESGITVVFVTHDIDEAVYLADRIVVLTGAPTTVREIVAVELPRPRDQVATKQLAEFASLRTHVYRLIQQQAGAARRPDSTVEPQA